MCGIAGIYNMTPGPRPQQNTLQAMTEAFHYRGPDEAGYHVDDHVGLGIRRLAIIDVEHGQQPIDVRESAREVDLGKLAGALLGQAVRRRGGGGGENARHGPIIIRRA